MAILAAYMVPHPPMIVPDVGRGSEKQVEKTIAAYEKVAGQIAALKPEAIANAIAHAIGQPDDVDTSDIVVRPVAHPA